MDFIFDDDLEEVGSEIDGYCPKCKADTRHTIITKYEDEVRRVQCNPCGDVHSYRKPRGDIDDDIPEPIAARRRATLRKPTWEEAMADAKPKTLEAARPYSIRECYVEGDVVTHPKFGIGFVTEIVENKAEITFKDERRLLVHNRPDLAPQMPGLAAPVEERREKPQRGRKKGRPAKEPAAPKPAPAQAAKPEPAPEKPAKAKAATKAKAAVKVSPARKQVSGKAKLRVKPPARKTAGGAKKRVLIPAKKTGAKKAIRPRK